MTSHSKPLVQVDLDDPVRGRIDRARLGKRNEADTEVRPVVTEADARATREAVVRVRRAADRRAAR